MEKVTTILKNNNLRITPAREQVLEFLMNKEHTVNSLTIERQFPDIDRVTIYRTLQTFLECKIIHKIIDEGSTPGFAVDLSLLREKKMNSQEAQTLNNAEHIHFKCNNCGNTYCIDEHFFPPIKLPEGFKVESTVLIVRGHCKNC